MHGSTSASPLANPPVKLRNPGFLGWWWLMIVWGCIGVVLATNLQLERKELHTDEARRLELLATSVASTITEELTSINEVLESLAHAPVPSDPAAHHLLNTRLETLAEAMPGVRTFALLNAQGVTIASSRDSALSHNFSQRSYFQRARHAAADTLILSEPFKPFMGGWSVLLGRVVSAEDGQFAGLAIAILDPDRFLGLLKITHFAPDTLTGLTHGNGQRFLVYSSTPTAPDANLAQPGTIFTRHRLGDTNTSVLEGSVLPGEPERLMAMHTIEPASLKLDNPLILGVGRDLESIFAAWHTKVWQLVFFYCLAALTLLFCILYLQRRRQLIYDQLAFAEQRASLETRWRVVMEATNQGVWDWQRRFRDTYFSPQWNTLLGYNNQQPAPHWKELIHPEDREGALLQLNLHLSGQSDFFENTHRLRCRSGHYKWIQFRGRVIQRSQSGKPVHFIGTFADATEQHLQQLQRDLLAENVPGMLYQYQRSTDGHSFFPYTSNGVQDIYAVTPEQAFTDVGLVFQRIHPDDLAHVEQTILHSASSLDIWQCEYRVNLPGRGERWLSGYARPQRLDSGDTLWHGYIHDVTDTKHQAIQLQETGRVLRHLMGKMPIGLAMVNEQDQFYFRNQLFNQYFSFDPQQPLDMDMWWDTIYPDPLHRSQVKQFWEQEIRRARASDGIIPGQELRTRALDGTERTMLIGGITFGEQFLATFEDRTAHAQEQEQLRSMAFFDALTGIANRRHFDHSLDAEWRRARRQQTPLTVMMIDIDFFKQYNDIYGHPQGDACLRTVAQCIKGLLKRSHDLLARYGGEEFVCLLPDCSTSHARLKALEILQAIQALAIPHEGSSIGPYLSLSIGIASLDGNTLDSGQLLAIADYNLYQAKRNGRNRAHDGQDLLC